MLFGIGELRDCWLKMGTNEEEEEEAAEPLPPTELLKTIVLAAARKDVELTLLLLSILLEYCVCRCC